MRDPKRIRPTLDAIEKVWNKYPDWRLGQLIVNANGNRDPFYLEDDLLINKLRGMDDYLSQ